MKEPVLGISQAEIDKVEAQLSIKFPDKLKKAWLNYNVIELRGGWFVFPIFDSRNPRKTCSHIVYENRNGWKELQPENTIAIADNGTGNQLLLKIQGGISEEVVYHWNHESGKLKIWKPGLDSILLSAEKSRLAVEKLFIKYSA